MLTLNILESCRKQMFFCMFSIVKFHPDPKVSRIYGASMDCKIRCWDLNTSKLLGVLEGHFSVVTGLTFFTSSNQAVS